MLASSVCIISDDWLNQEACSGVQYIFCIEKEICLYHQTALCQSSYILLFKIYVLTYPIYNEWNNAKKNKIINSSSDATCNFHWNLNFSQICIFRPPYLLISNRINEFQVSLKNFMLRHLSTMRVLFFFPIQALGPFIWIIIINSNHASSLANTALYILIFFLTTCNFFLLLLNITIAKC